MKNNDYSDVLTGRTQKLFETQIRTLEIKSTPERDEK